ncbi:winged helix-turn-helix domain-containing protein (plasmid) [Paraburkholderia sp. PREW-6R]|uniref:winged helix-turn-helix domain-containing protein n=1 Tax=Paraburkholderia sp. PREW-6R TaxID=3141544 RepID=UPI0031F4B78F
MTTITRHERFELNGQWIFDEMTGSIGRTDDPCLAVCLKPIDARILGVLVRNPLYTFSRQRLFDEGWRCYGFEVCENSLNQVICSLRASFARLGPLAPTIRTVPRIGYCLVADVTHEASVPAGASTPAFSLPQHAASGMPAACKPQLAARELFDIVSEQEWRRALRNRRPLSLLMVGLHSQGGFVDAAGMTPVIEEVITSRIHRAGDFAAHYSASEYAVLLPETDWQGSACVARDIQTTVTGRTHGRVPGTAPQPVVAVGQACTAQRRYENREAWTEAARQALRTALDSAVTRPSLFAVAA